MRLFYITTLEAAQTLNGWHSIALPNDKILLCVDWNNPVAELEWRSRPDVISLPHPIFESSATLSTEHLKHLCGKYPLTANHTVHHVIKMACCEDPWMRIHVL